ncbi:GntR family transcriptional regulator [Micromonospora sp. NPDC005206]|uniref:GntR family transcriptional regulator n=1 Tax=Micromonospora sp. NPDC005206 TaxID=3157022 RepID=UPI0033BCB203
MPYEQALWLQIRDDLRRKIKAGIYPPGSKLPSVRLLAEQWDTSHMTIRRAVDSMIQNDELIGRVGRGIFVAGKTDA